MTKEALIDMIADLIAEKHLLNANMFRMKTAYEKQIAELKGPNNG
jgi:hypothetical protein